MCEYIVSLGVCENERVSTNECVCLGERACVSVCVCKGLWESVYVRMHTYLCVCTCVSVWV